MLPIEWLVQIEESRIENLLTRVFCLLQYFALVLSTYLLPNESFVPFMNAALGLVCFLCDVQYEMH